MDYNRAIIVGRVTAAPELRTTPSGQSVTALRMATNRSWTDKEGKKQENVQFHSVVIWGRTAEVAAQFLMKGSACLIEGRLETREWTDKQGAKHWTTEIICENLQLGARPQADAASKVAGVGGVGQPKEKKPAAPAVPEFEPDDYEIKPEDIPF